MAAAVASGALIEELYIIFMERSKADECVVEHNIDQVKTLRSALRAIDSVVASFSASQLQWLHKEHILQRVGKIAESVARYIQSSSQSSAVKYKLWRRWFDQRFKQLDEDLLNIELSISASLDDYKNQFTMKNTESIFNANIPIGDIRSFGIIGCGNYDYVWLSTLLYPATERFVAIKHFILRSDAHYDTTLQSLFTNEALLVHRLAQSCHCIVNIIGLCGISIPPAPDMTNDLTSVGLVMEYMNCGSVHTILNQTRLSWSERWQLAYQCVGCVHLLHSLSPPIIHGNIKSHNFLVKRHDTTGQLIVKIADLGLTGLKMASVLSTSEQAVKDRVRWTAPEVLSYMPYTIKSDIYSLGVVLWEITQTTKRDEFAAFDDSAMAKAVIAGSRPQFSADVPAPWKRIIELCWSADENQRPTSAQLMSMMQAEAVAMGMMQDAPSAPLISLSVNKLSVNSDGGGADGHENMHAEGERPVERRGLIALILSAMCVRMNEPLVLERALFILTRDRVLFKPYHFHSISRLRGLAIVYRAMVQHKSAAMIHSYSCYLLSQITEFTPTIVPVLEVALMIPIIISDLDEFDGDEEVLNECVGVLRSLEVRHPDREYVITHIQHSGGVEALVRLLGRTHWLENSSSLAGQIMGALIPLLTTDDVNDVIVQNNGLATLIKILKSLAWESEPIQFAVYLLTRILYTCRKSDTQPEFAITELLNTVTNTMISDKSKTSLIQRRCLQLLSIFPEQISPILSRNNGIEHVVDVLKTFVSNEIIYKQATFVLCRAAHNQQCRKRIVKAGAIEPIIEGIKKYQHPDYGPTLLCIILTYDPQQKPSYDNESAVIISKLMEDDNIVQSIPRADEYILASEQSKFCVKQGFPSNALCQCLKDNQCTFSVTGASSHVSQWIVECFTCGLTAARGRGVCLSCSRICHDGHNISPPSIYTPFNCDCSENKEKYVCKLIPLQLHQQQQEEEEQPLLQPVGEV